MPYIIGALVILLICLVVGSVVAFAIIKPRKRSLLDTSIIEENRLPGIMKFYQESLTEQYKIESKFGYELQLYYLENKVKSNKFMVMSHGHIHTHHGCLKYARMMMKHGYNIVLYDQRYHGNSSGKFTSLGHLEKEDLYTVISDTFNRFGEDIFLGTYGESMGAATVLLEAEIDKRVKFVVSDSAFSDFGALLKELIMTRYHIPVFPFYGFTLFMFRIFTGFPMKRISPINAINNVSVPIMFVHGYDDDFINYTHTEKMYNSYKGDKQLFLAGNGAYHVGSYYTNIEEYEKNINEFIIKYVNKK